MTLHKIIISLASNCDQEANIAEARRRLDDIITPRRYTDAIWTEPIRSTRPDLYLNQLVEADTALSADDLEAALKRIEADMGRTAEDRREGLVRIDLDLLLFDRRRYHERDWERPYVKKLLRMFGRFNFSS